MYNSKETIINNIISYMNNVEKLYLVDNSEKKNANLINILQLLSPKCIYIDNKVKALAGLFGPINGAIFPYVSKLVKESEIDAKKFIKKIVIYSSVFMLMLSSLTFIFAKEIILIVSSEGFEQSVLILRILSIFPLIITLARIFSTNYLINFHYQNELSKIYLYSAIFSLVLSFSLVPFFQAIGSAVTVIATELFATIYMYMIIKRKILDV